MERYNRHIILSDVGQEGQNKLLKAKVLVIGAGGLGCPILQYLAAAGVGTIGIIDFDVVETSNLQRQILFGTSSLGQNKAIAAKNRLEDLNPTITIDAFPEKLTASNALQHFKNYDIIVDGTDNFSTRYLINDAAVLTNKPIVYGAIYKFEGQVSVFNYNNGPSYRCLFPNPPKEGSVVNCSEVGVLGVLPGIIGTMQANEVLKIILEFDDVLSGKLYCYHSKTTSVTTLNIQRNNASFENIQLTKVDFQNESCQNHIKEISAEALLNLENIQFIDVRGLDELPELNVSNGIKIPLAELENSLDKIDQKATIVVFCQSGMRSKKAVKLLNKNQIDNCFSLKNGVSSLIKQQV